MWQLYKKYYSYSRDYFMDRIHSNNYFSFYTQGGKVVGFTGLRINRTEINDRQCLLIYFGQTIIDENYRGKALIPRTGTKLMLRYWKDLIKGNLFVWADALSYKAYLVFAKTLKEYYPGYEKPTPDRISQLINFVGYEYYETTFDASSGTVRKDTVFVSDPSIRIDRDREQDLDVLFYAGANPDYIKGHGLITMAPMHSKNYMTMFLKCMHRWFSNTKKKKKAQRSQVVLPQPMDQDVSLVPTPTK